MKTEDQMNGKRDPNTMCYAAVDPEQPGAAFAVTVDDGTHLAEMHETLAEWARRGGVPTRMKLTEGVAMMGRWLRPEPEPDLLPLVPN